jgi:hypothetical protein
MGDEIDGILSRLEQIDPPQDLWQRVMLRVEQEALARSRTRLILSGSFGIAALFLSVISIILAIAEFWSRGTFHFLSLIVTDFDLAISHSATLLWAVLESLPVANILMTLTAFLLTLVLLQFFLSNLLVRERILKTNS